MKQWKRACEQFKVDQTLERKQKQIRFVAQQVKNKKEVCLGFNFMAYELFIISAVLSSTLLRKRDTLPY